MGGSLDRAEHRSGRGRGLRGSPNPFLWTFEAGVGRMGENPGEKRNRGGEAAGMLSEEGVRPPG